MSPATWSQPSASAIPWPPVPITATSSTSQSTFPGESRMSPAGPVKLEGYLVNTTGSVGSAKPDSAAWSR